MFQKNSVQKISQVKNEVKSRMAKNRYNVKYCFEYMGGDKYKFVIDDKELSMMRYGGKEDQPNIDMSDLGMFDPPGGPYVAIGSTLYWDEIVFNDKVKSVTVSSIYVQDNDIIVEAK